MRMRKPHSPGEDGCQARPEVQSALFCADPSAPLTSEPAPCDLVGRSAPGVLDWEWMVGTHVIDTYAPHNAGPAWPRVAEEVRRAVKRTGPTPAPVARQLVYVMAQLALFADGRGVAASAEAWLTHEMIEAFVASRRAHVTQSTQGNYRSRLRRLRTAVFGPDLASGDPARLSGSRSSRPYSLAELTDRWEWANCRPTPYLRTGMKSLMALGLGCGLDTHEAQWVRARHVCRDAESGAVLVEVPGARPRVTVCRRAWEKLLIDAAGALEPDQFLIRPDAPQRGKNIIANFVARARKGSDHPGISLGRARATWIVELVDEGIPLTTLVAAAGVDTLHALSRLMPYFAPVEAARGEQLLRGHA